MKIVHTPSTQDNGIRLTANEAYLLRMFRQVTDARQVHVLVFMEQSISDPSSVRAKFKPSLQVIAGGSA